MITRPLDLAAKLQTRPRNFDALFYANVILLGLFFSIFGAQFVLSPGVELRGGGPLQEPQMAGAIDGALRTAVVISVLRAGMVFTEDGPKSYGELEAWLPQRAATLTEREPRLLVRADAGVPMQDIMRIHDMATAAGFAGVQVAAEPVRPEGGGE